MSHDPYCYPGTNVLRNKLNITDEVELRATEARVAAVALFAFEGEPLRGPMDEARLKTTHRAIFEELYDWAGRYRENIGTMTKGRAAGYQVTYGGSEYVPDEMKRIFSELAAEDYLHGLDEDKFSGRLSYFYSELDSTHPFREGNSRTLRKFSADIASSAGYELDWEPTGQSAETRNALYTARDFAFTQKRYDRLIQIIRGILSPLQP